MVSPSFHAARLRTLAKLAGMMAHPEKNKVWSSSGGKMNDEKMMELIRIIMRSTPVTIDDLNDYAANTLKTLRVVKNSDGRFVFQYVEISDE